MAVIDEQMAGWIEAMQFMDTIDQFAAYSLCMEGEVRFGWEAFTDARKENGAHKDWKIFANRVEQNMAHDDGAKAQDSVLAERLEEAIQALQVQADTLAMLINSEAKLTRERDEARKQAYDLRVYLCEQTSMDDPADYWPLPWERGDDQ